MRALQTSCARKESLHAVATNVPRRGLIRALVFSSAAGAMNEWAFDADECASGDWLCSGSLRGNLRLSLCAAGQLSLLSARQRSGARTQLSRLASRDPDAGWVHRSILGEESECARR